MAAAQRCRRHGSAGAARAPARSHRLRADVARDAGVHRRARRRHRGRDLAAEHPPVYTLGVAGPQPSTCRASPNGIPVVRSDRGGQITYHGPGQVVAYLLLDLRRRGLSVRPLVRIMEQRRDRLARGVRRRRARARRGAGRLRGRRQDRRAGTAHHATAAAITVSRVNVDMDLAPFHAIDPCGYPGLRRDAGARTRHRRDGRNRWATSSRAT